MTPKLQEIFNDAFGELRSRTPAPPFHIRFYPFVSLNNTIRLRQGEIYVRLSDLLEGAPDSVLHSILHILLAKLYRKPIDRTHSARYRRYVGGHDLSAKARLVRQMRGRKHASLPPRAIIITLRNFSRISTAVSFTAFSGDRNSPGARITPAAASATTIPHTMPSSSAASSTILACPATPSNTSCFTRCCT